MAAAAALAAAAGACEQAKPPQALVVAPEARALEFRRSGELWQVYYEVPVAYPAEPVLAHIRATLERAGWHALPNDFLNPYLPSSHRDGWRSHIESTGGSGLQVHQWLAQWTNPQGDVVSFALQYRYAVKGPPELTTLRVHGAHTPRQVAEMQLEAANAGRSSSK